MSQLPKRHLDRFSCFPQLTPCGQHTDRHTDTQITLRATSVLCSNRPHLMLCVQAMRPNDIHVNQHAKVISFRSYCPDTWTNTQPTYCFTWTTTNEYKPFLYQIWCFGFCYIIRVWFRYSFL